MVEKIWNARFLGLTLVERGYKIHSSIALFSSAMSHTASPQPAEHTSMQLEISAIDTTAVDPVAAAAAAALLALPQAADAVAAGQSQR